MIIFCSLCLLRLSFWLSNIIVLREIISQAFGGSRSSSPFTRFVESNGVTKSADGRSTVKWKGPSNNKPRNGFMHVVDDWQETGTFIGALEKIESWIFSRIVESVWWQVDTVWLGIILAELPYKTCQITKLKGHSPPICGC